MLSNKQTQENNLFYFILLFSKIIFSYNFFDNQAELKKINGKQFLTALCRKRINGQSTKIKGYFVFITIKINSLTTPHLVNKNYFCSKIRTILSKKKIIIFFESSSFYIRGLQIFQYKWRKQETPNFYYFRVICLLILWGLIIILGIQSLNYGRTSISSCSLVRDQILYLIS